jgi:coenzyme F420-reducing hydrogenase beta subunit
MEFDQSMDPCTHCGACFSFCEWDSAVAEGLNPGPEICRDCQTCYRICPRLPFDASALAASMFPSASPAAWGLSITAGTGQACPPESGVQDGGIASMLGRYLLRTRQVDAVLVTGRDAEWRPVSYWATDEAGVQAAAGSKYSTAPGLSVLQPGLDRFERVAVIALPCQSAALARFRQSRPQYGDKLAMVIGLFCSKTFVHGDQRTPGLSGFIRDRLNRPMAEIERFDIRRGRFIARAGETTAEWRIKELADLAWPICAACADLTAELADVSLGSVGSSEGKSSIIVRSERAQALVEAGVREGLLEIGPLENAEALEKLCNSKRHGAEQLPEEQRKLLGRAAIRGNWHRQRRRSA